MKLYRFGLLLFITAMSCLTGCMQYVLVEMRDYQKYPPKPDVVVGSSIGKVDKSIVIQMPDSCFESGSRAIASGEARESNVVLSTYCSNWVTGVEKELIRKGFQVKSSLELAITLKQGKKTLVESARGIGAGTVLQINTLEFPALKSDPKTLKYLQSNKYAENLGPIELQEYFSKKIGGYIQDAVEKSGRIEAGLLDCKIIDVGTQDTVYYFNYKVRSGTTEGDFLFRYSTRKYEIIPVKPAVKGGSFWGNSPPPKTSGQSTLFMDQVVDPTNRQKEILADKLSQEFVKYFSETVSNKPHR